MLELGCADGGNLIPMAELLPQSQFIGIDGSTVQITEGRKVVKEFALKNIRLQAMDILEVNLSLGHFDYIICHGVFSWVPVDTQERIFTLCQNHLAPQGVAYISYNTYPGWHMRGMIRDMMLYHAVR